MTALCELVGDRVEEVVAMGDVVILTFVSGIEVQFPRSVVAQGRDPSVWYTMRRLPKVWELVIGGDSTQGWRKELYERRQLELAKEQVYLDDQLQRLCVIKPKPKLPKTAPPRALPVPPPALRHIRHDPLWVKQLEPNDLYVLAVLASHLTWAPPRVILRAMTYADEPYRKRYGRLQRLFRRGLVERAVRGKPIVIPQFNYRITSRGRALLAQVADRDVA